MSMDKLWNEENEVKHVLSHDGTCEHEIWLRNVRHDHLTKKRPRSKTLQTIS